MAKARKVVLLSFLLLVPLIVRYAECANPAGPKQTEVNNESSEFKKEMSMLKESMRDSVKSDLLEFFVPLILTLILGGGFGAWFLLKKELKESLSKDLESETKDFINKATDPLTSYIEEQGMVSISDRENSIGAFWEQLYEESSEETVGRPRYLDLSLESYERALSSATNLEEERYERRICIYKNNIAYCLSLRAGAGIANVGVDKERALELITYALNRAHKFPDLGYRFQETHGWVLLRFAGESHTDREQGKTVIEGVLSRGDIPREWHQRRLERYQSFLQGTA